MEKESRLPDKEQLLTAFRQEESTLIARTYDRYRDEFVAFALSRFSIQEDRAIDIYQDSFVALYRNIKDGKLNRLSASLKTYLFQIGKHKMLNYVNRDKKRETADSLDDLQPETACPDTRDTTWTRMQEITYHTVSRMDEPCNTILSLFYWQEQSMATIAKAMNYKNEQVAKNRKWICIRKLKAVLKEKFHQEELL